VSWWPRQSTADRVLAGALVTRRHFLKGAAILGVVAVAVAPRVLVQVPESLVWKPKPNRFYATQIGELEKLLRDVYFPAIEYQQNIDFQAYIRFERMGISSAGARAWL